MNQFINKLKHGASQGHQSVRKTSHHGEEKDVSFVTTPPLIFQRWLFVAGWTQQDTGSQKGFLFFLLKGSASHHQGQRPVDTRSALELGQMACDTTRKTLQNGRAFQGHLKNVNIFLY